MHLTCLKGCTGYYFSYTPSRKTSQDGLLKLRMMQNAEDDVAEAAEKLMTEASVELPVESPVEV